LDFKIDENLPVEAAQLLIQAGHSVSTVLEEGLGGTPDETLVQAAGAEGRILVTLDTGFADIRRYPPSESRGLIVLRLRRQDKGGVLRALAHAAAQMDREALAGRLWIVEDDRIRIRS